MNIPIITCNNMVLDCFFGGGRDRSHRDMSRQVRQLSEAYEKTGYDVFVLPVDHAKFQVDNLYPVSNHVDTWNTFVVGNDGTYILANANTLALSPEDYRENGDDVSDATRRVADALLNRKAGGLLEPGLTTFLQPIWDVTLKDGGAPIQVFIVVRNQTFILNTYPLRRHDGHVVGGVMFIRFFRIQASDVTAILKGRKSLDEVLDAEAKKIS